MIISSFMATKVASNDDLLNEILLRLPVKPLLRFKCVSKHWLSLISEPKFCHSHTLRQYRTSSIFPSALLLATNSSSRCPIIPLKCNNGSDSSCHFLDVKVPNVTIMQSCNGLILLERMPLKNSSKVEYFIYNPTTHQSVTVSFPTRQFRSSVLSLFICFEPFKSPHYKLVSIRFKNFTSFSDMMNHGILRSTLDDPEYVINVYSSETRSWSEPGISFTAPDAELLDQINAVYFNGALYWYSDAVRKYRCFDLETQSFKTFLMPSQIEERRVLYFGESGGHLHFVVDSLLDLELDILELNEENSEWSVRFHVNLNPMMLSCPHLVLWELSLQTGMFFVYCVVNQQNDEDSMFVFFLDGKVMSYNLVDCTFLELSSFSSFLRDAPRCYIYQHYENLSWVGPTNA